jgi:hypothetical protein
MKFPGKKVIKELNEKCIKYVFAAEERPFCYKILLKRS